MAEAELILNPGGIDDGTRECGMCRSRKPLTAQFFSRDASGPQGFYATCRECRSKKRRDDRLKTQIAEVQRIKMQINRKIASGEARQVLPNDEELASILLNEWGGERQMMIDLVADYKASPIGPTRQKLLDLAVSIIHKGNSNRPVVPLDAMSDDELDAALENAISRRLTNNDGSGGTAKPETEATVG